MSSSSSISSRSGSSDDSNSEYDGGILSASQFDRQKARRSIHPIEDESINHDHTKLTSKRHYPSPIPSSRAHNDTNDIRNNALYEKSDMEKAVLMDCLIE
jgi:hypothetical protein